MLKRTFAVIALLLIAVPAAGQSSRTAVGVSESFTVAVTPPKDGETKFVRLYLDGTKVGADVSASPAVEAPVTVPGIASPGAHVLEASAVNDFGESVLRTRLNFWVGPPPAPGLRIIEKTTTISEFAPDVTADGLPTLRLVASTTTHDVQTVK